MSKKPESAKQLRNASARKARDAAIDRVESNPEAVAWMQKAASALRKVASKKEFFTTDDLWLLISPFEEPRIMGALMRTSHVEGLCEPTTRTLNSSRRTCHARPLRIWRSMIV
jgi:hypothetical protein